MKRTVSDEMLGGKVEVSLKTLRRKDENIERLKETAHISEGKISDQEKEISALKAENRQLQGYVAFLEGKYVEALQAKRKELSKSLRANEKLFDFISQKEMVNFSSGRDTKRKKIEKVVGTQLAKYDEIIAGIKGFKQVDGCPFGEELQLAIFETACRLLEPAINLGYCKEARELIRIAKNPRLVGNDLAAANVDDKILKVANAYGKRNILEGGKYEDDIKEEINDLVLGVKKGKYGTCALSQDKIEQAYQNATAKIGDTILHMDGSHNIDNGKEKQ